MYLCQNFQKQPLFTGLAVAALFAVALMSPAAQAHGMHHEGYEHHYHHGYAIEPHNAAIHYIMMAHELGLTHEQVGKLIKMRDEYIKNNSVAENQMKADRMDLAWLLYADKFDKAAINKKLGEIGQFESQLWKNYVDQLAEINALLTDKQKHRLKELYSQCHHYCEEHGHMMMNKDMHENEHKDHGEMGGGNMGMDD